MARCLTCTKPWYKPMADLIIDKYNINRYFMEISPKIQLFYFNEILLLLWFLSSLYKPLSVALLFTNVTINFAMYHLSVKPCMICELLWRQLKLVWHQWNTVVWGHFPKQCLRAVVGFTYNVRSPIVSFVNEDLKSLGWGMMDSALSHPSHQCNLIKFNKTLIAKS